MSASPNGIAVALSTDKRSVVVVLERGPLLGQPLPIGLDPGAAIELGVRLISAAAIVTGSVPQLARPSGPIVDVA